MFFDAVVQGRLLQNLEMRFTLDGMKKAYPIR